YPGRRTTRRKGTRRCLHRARSRTPRIRRLGKQSGRIAQRLGRRSGLLATGTCGGAGRAAFRPNRRALDLLARPVANTSAKAEIDMKRLILPGWYGSGPGHWQRIWAASDPEAVVVEQDNWEEPDKESWIAHLHEALARHPGAMLV